MVPVGHWACPGSAGTLHAPVAPAPQSPARTRHRPERHIIEENRERYYETLQLSSQGWHEGKHDPWPYIGYLLYIVKKAYDEFERRGGQTKAPKGEKTALVEATIAGQAGPFTVADIRDACPGVGVDLIRKVLGRLKGDQVECLGRGQSAQWRRLN